MYKFQPLVHGHNISRFVQLNFVRKFICTNHEILVVDFPRKSLHHALKLDVIKRTFNPLILSIPCSFNLIALKYS